MRTKKDLKRKQPTRRSTEQYWTKEQWEKLRTAPPRSSPAAGRFRGGCLAYMLQVSPDVEPIRKLVGKRLMESGKMTGAQKQLDQMLLTLWAGGYVRWSRSRPCIRRGRAGDGAKGRKHNHRRSKVRRSECWRKCWHSLPKNADPATPTFRHPRYHSPPLPLRHGDRLSARLAHPTDTLPRLLRFRGINPLYGMYLVGQLGIASREERIQAFESVLEMPGSVAKLVRVPRYDDMPPGPLATTRLDIELLQRGLATPEQLGAKPAQEEEPAEQRREMFAEKVWPLTLGEKLRLLFDSNYPHVHSLMTTSVWAAGEVLEFGGQFNKYITSRGLQKQEGVIFRHLLRLILLLKEFEAFAPPDCPADEWLAELREISAVLTEGCRRVDPTSTDKALEEAEQGNF